MDRVIRPTIVSLASALVWLVVNSFNYKTTDCIESNSLSYLTQSSAQKLNFKKEENRGSDFYRLGQGSKTKCERSNQNEGN